jgi:methionyl-tRNA formyltransferase
VLMCRPERGQGAPGTALDDRLLVACGEGALRLTRLQRPGRAAADAAELLRGFPVPPGTRLG